MICDDLVKHASVFRVLAQARGGAGVLFICDDELFLMRRSRFVNNPLTWSVPGGGSEPNETKAETAKREVIEEVGSMPPIKRVINYSIFVCEITPQAKNEWKPMLNWEHETSGWFKLNELPMDLFPGLKNIIDKLKTLS